MRFRIRTIMIAIAIVGLVTALVVLRSRARDEIPRAYVDMKMEMAAAEARARSAEQRAIAAEARAKLLEAQARAVLERSSHVDKDRDTSQKSPTRQPPAAK